MFDSHMASFVQIWRHDTHPNDTMPNDLIVTLSIFFALMPSAECYNDECLCAVYLKLI